MNDNQFKDLDEVMKNNPPLTNRSLKPLTLPKSKPRFLWKSFAFGATALIVITFVQNSNYNTKMESVLALNETMSWDATSDDEDIIFLEWTL